MEEGKGEAGCSGSGSWERPQAQNKPRPPEGKKRPGGVLKKNELTVLNIAVKLTSMALTFSGQQTY